MPPVILGLHHVTATVDDAQDDLDFCVGALALRLVKKTVNFDNRHVYHFYYGDERGTPGTIWTTFPYKGHGVTVGKKGTGQIVATSFSVPAGSLTFWRSRLEDRGIAVNDVEERFGDATIACADPSGLEFELIANKDDRRTPWLAEGMDGDAAVLGLHSVTLDVRTAAPTIEFMSDTLGFKVIERAGQRTRLEVGGGGPGKTIDVVEAPKSGHAMNGLGTVHHVAMAIGSGEEQRRVREDLVAAGYRVTDVLDRCYFTSIYFREPGGVLFEIATVPPGFLVDEKISELGTSLKLPPWEEARRASIEAGLPTVVHP